MKLNDFTILNMSIGDTDFYDSRDFIKALKSRRMLADVYVDAHKVATSAVWFTEENGWLYANLGCRFALSEPVLAKSILVKVYGAGSNVITMSSFTEVSEYIETGDQEMELHGSVMSATPYNSMRKPTKTSKIRWLRSFLIAASKLSDLPTDQSVVVEPDSDEPATYGNTDLSGIGSHCSVEVDNDGSTDGIYKFRLNVDDCYRITRVAYNIDNGDDTDLSDNDKDSDGNYVIELPPHGTVYIIAEAAYAADYQTYVSPECTISVSEETNNNIFKFTILTVSDGYQVTNVAFNTGGDNTTIEPDEGEYSVNLPPDRVTYIVITTEPD